MTFKEEKLKEYRSKWFSQPSIRLEDIEADLSQALDEQKARILDFIKATYAATVHPGYRPTYEDLIAAITNL